MSKGVSEEYPDTEYVLNHPHEGDLLCFNGKEWKVARRDGWYYKVPPLHTSKSPTKDKAE